jgi:multicomponent Na+:H+ antiporter subunit F
MDALDLALEISFDAALALMAAGILCAGFRLLRGPTLPDRVAGIDAVALLGVGAITIYAMWVEQSIYLYVSVAMALLIFLGTVGFAYYLEVSKKP